MGRDITSGSSRKFQTRVYVTLMVLASYVAVGASVAIANGEGVSVETHLRGDRDLTLFTKAMDIAYFWGRLSETDDVTLFVPTDTAMTVEGSDFLLRSVLMTAENRQRLEALVGAHIVVGTVEIDQGDHSMLLPTMSGDCLMFGRVDSEMKVGPGASVIADRQLGRARVIIVDKLLIPDYQASAECVEKQALVRN